MRISLENIEVGMCVGQDLFTESGQLITPSNTIVTEEIIKRLKKFKINVIEINGNDLSDNIFEIKNTESFKEFQNECTATKKSLSSSFDEILQDNAQSSQISIIKGLSSILYENNKSNLNLMDMVYNMHEHSDLVYTHSINVGMIAGCLGRWLGFSEKDVQVLISCGLFHDVGKLLIPKEILEKPDKLTDDEYEIIKTHTTKGFNLLEPFDNLDERIKNVALLHHERCDGTGYPLHVKSNALDKFSKIVAIADTYEAMTSSRTYRNPICPFTVAKYFEKEGLHQFDTQYVLKFIDKMLVSYLHSNVMLSNQKKASVVMINKRIKSRPLVALEDGTFIDLSKTTDIDIVDIIN